MGTAILFTSAADMFEAISLANDRAVQHSAHVRVFRAVQRDRTEAWQRERVAVALRDREARERAADERIATALAIYTSANAIC